MARLSKKDKELLAAEQKAAESYLCSHLKMTGPIEYIDDGKTDLIASLPWPSLVRLLRDYGISRLASVYAPTSAAGSPHAPIHQ